VVGVKICGINDPAALDAAVAAGADWLGLVFFPRSPRFLTPAQAATLSARAPDARSEGGAKRVGLFVAPSDEEIAATLAAVRLDVLQLYVDAERAAALRRHFGVPVWRAVGIAKAGDLPVSAEGVDGLLLDGKAPPTAERPGGNAQPFDWTVLRHWEAPVPWVLAGGLHPGNVAEAVRLTGAPAVDVSSGVESAPGKKDPALIHRFVAAARELNQI